MTENTKTASGDIVVAEMLENIAKRLRAGELTSAHCHERVEYVTHTNRAGERRLVPYNPRRIRIELYEPRFDEEKAEMEKWLRDTAHIAPDPEPAEEDGL